MHEDRPMQDYFRDRAAREIALAEATGAAAHASPDFRTVFIRRRDGTRETVHLPERDRRH